MYSGGVITSSSCGITMDHAVLVTGYGVTTGKTPFWIVKNSWGSSWGLSGYVWIGRGGSGPGVCGIAQNAVYPTA